MNSKPTRHSIDTLFTFLLLLSFLLFSLLVAGTGSIVYQNGTDSLNKNYTSRTALSYLTEKLRQHDHTDGISIRELDGIPSLVLYEEQNGTHYCSPVMVLVGAMLVFGERLNLYQWIGVMLAVLSFFMLSRSGKKEGIDFKHNKWILFIVLAAVTGAVSGLYDKYLMKQLNPMLVQSWYNVYQVFIMCPIILLLWYPKRKESTPFRWDWTIICISVFLCAADFVYFYALSYEDSMISIVSMVRRGSVVVSFLFGALFFREKNLKSKAVDLILVLIGMFFLYLGSK